MNLARRRSDHKPTTRYRCQRSGTPFSSCSPASSKVRAAAGQCGEEASRTTCRELRTGDAREVCADTRGEVYPPLNACKEVAP